MTVYGTVAVSPAANTRLRTMVNFVLPLASVIALFSAASETVRGVGSLSAMVMATSLSAPGLRFAGSAPNSTTTVSGGSSVLSSTAVNVVVPVVAPWGIEMVVAPSW